MASAPHERWNVSNSVWPAGYPLVEHERWTTRDGGSWVAHDHIEHHGIYAHVDATVQALAAELRDGDIVLDHEGGTGILVDRMRRLLPESSVGVLIADSSARDLQAAMEKYRGDPLVALRLRRFLDEERRLESLDEVVGDAILERGVDAIVCSHAAFMYPDLVDTASSWKWLLRRGGRAFINSGSIGSPSAGRDEWLLDETVWDIDQRAQAIVRSDDRYRRYRDGLDDAERMRAYELRRSETFHRPLPRQHYLDALQAGGLSVEGIREAKVDTPLTQWFGFLSSHHEAVLGWVGGSETIDGTSAAPQAVGDRLQLMRRALDEMFRGRGAVTVSWTYITCRKRED